MIVDEWKSIGPTLMDRHVAGLGSTGRITAVSVDPTDSRKIYAGSRWGGLWKTRDGGATWTAVDAEFPTRRISAVAVDPNDPRRVYALVMATMTGTEAHLFRSINEGEKWSAPLSTVGALVEAGQLVVAPGDPMRMYCPSQDGIHATFNGGVSPWLLSLTAPANGSGRSIALDPVNTGTVYAGVQQAGIFKCTDKGSKGGAASWTRLDGKLPTAPGEYDDVSLCLCRDHPSVLYAGIVTNGAPYPFRLYFTDDGGLHWWLKFQLDSKAWPSLAFCGYVGVANDAPNEVYIAGVPFMRSTDYGQSFSTADEIHVDHHAFLTDPAAPGVIFTGCDGGLFRSADRGLDGTWKQIGEGIANVEMCHLANHPVDPDRVFAGTWDNLAVARRAGTTVWDEMPGPYLNGDIVYVTADDRDPPTLYRVSDWGYQIDFWRSDNGGNKWEKIGAELPSGYYARHAGFGPVVRGCEPHRHEPGTVMVAAGKLYQGLPGAGGWTWPPQLAVTNADVTHWAVDGQRNEYAGTSDGRVLLRPAGNSWSLTPLFTHPSGSRVIDLQVDRFDDTNLYAAFDQAGPHAVYLIKRVSADPARVVPHDIHDAFDPHRWVGCLAIDPFRPYVVYVGTDVGIFRGTGPAVPAASWGWQPYSNGLPPVGVNTIAVHPRTGVLRAATWGCGAFETVSDEPIGSLVQAAGRIAWLSVREPGSGYGAPGDEIDADVVIGLDTLPGRAFGFQLRGPDPLIASEMLATIRTAQAHGGSVHLQYVRASLSNNMVERLITP